MFVEDWVSEGRGLYNCLYSEIGVFITDWIGIKITGVYSEFVVGHVSS